MFSVIVKIPRLLPEETIERLREKCKARLIWAKGSPRKKQYLLSHLVYDEESGYTLTGVPNQAGQRHYRPYQKVKQRYHINAEVLEKAVLDALLEALSCDRALIKAVFNGNPVGNVADELRTRYSVYEAELKSVEKKVSNLLNAITNFEGEGMGSFLLDLKDKIINLGETRSELKSKMQSIENQLRALPTHEEILATRDQIYNQLKQAMMESYFTSGHTLNNLPFEDKRKIVTMIFGGKDEEGKRYGIYIRPLGGDPRLYKFVAYGRLGNIHGWVESKTGEYASEAYDIRNRENIPGGEGCVGSLARVVYDSDRGFFEEYGRCETRSCKAHMLSKSRPVEGMLRVGEKAGFGGRTFQIRAYQSASRGESCQGKHSG